MQAQKIVGARKSMRLDRFFVLRKKINCSLHFVKFSAECIFKFVSQAFCGMSVDLNLAF